MTDPTSSLASRVIEKASLLVSAPEHTEIATLIMNADKYRLDDETTRDLGETLRRRTTSIEQNVDLIEPKTSATWIEFSDAPRRPTGAVAAEGVHFPVNVGGLICVDEDIPDRLVMITAWDLEDGSVHHSYATASLSLTDLAQLAWGARNRFAKDPLSSVTRLALQPRIIIPPGLGKEIQTLELLERPENPEEAVVQRVISAKREVASEVPFLLAAMLALASPNVQITPDHQSGLATVILPKTAKPRFRFPWQPTEGFLRLGSKREPQLGWLSPA